MSSVQCVSTRRRTERVGVYVSYIYIVHIQHTYRPEGGRRAEVLLEDLQDKLLEARQCSTTMRG